MSEYSQKELLQMASRWMPSLKQNRELKVHTDTSDYFRVDYGDIVLLDERPYLIRQCAREGRFGLEDDVKFWVKRSIDLLDGSPCIIKLVFYEKFSARIGSIEFDCFRSPRKEARILELVNDHKNFMHGFSVIDDHDNIVRILQVIHGKPLSRWIDELDLDHETYWHTCFSSVLKHFIDSVSAIQFLHDRGEKHGDIRRDHIFVDRKSSVYRWIDFDINYRHRENIYGYDLFGLGNILIYLAGKGDALISELQKNGHRVATSLSPADVNIVFRNRVANLRKLYPYIPQRFNRILMHFSKEANRFYEHTRQLLEDLSACRDLL
jgi:hypothetical protein